MIDSLAFRHRQISCSLKIFGVCVTEDAYCLLLKVEANSHVVLNCRKLEVGDEECSS
jgi:hypothetical protein